MTDAETEQLKTHLTEYVQANMEKTKGGGYVCPFCGSGTGTHKTGAFFIDKNRPTHWTCFSGECRKHGDLFDLIGKLEGIADFKARKERARELFPLSGKGGTAEAVRRESGAGKQEMNQKEDNYVEYILEKAEHIEETDYWKKRGLSLETVKRYKVGYDPAWTHPESKKAYPTPRLIIPTSDKSYTARRTDGEEAYKAMKAGKVHFYPLSVLQEESEAPLFIVEGEIDALSFAEVGVRAVAIGSTSMAKAFITYMNEYGKHIQGPIIVALDNDKRKGTKEASESIVKGLSNLGKIVYQYNVYGQYKDANEALVKDRTAFTEAVKKDPKDVAISEAEFDYAYKSDAFYLQEFQKEIERKSPRISTGFITLDEALGSEGGKGYQRELGGLYDGLYVIGGMSSVGKTTFCLQMIDQIAKAGHDCLVFSLEMSRYELTAKALSRLTMEIMREAGKSVSCAQTVRSITDPARRARYNQEQKDVYNGAIMRRMEYAERVYTIEPDEPIGTDYIKERVKQHVKIMGKAPVVLVDYLQILAPYNPKATDKQNTDRAVLDLKHISKQYNTPVIAISSFNRANYQRGASMEAFKESGAIEYSSDVLIGLQLKGAGEDKDFDINEAKKQDPREVEAVILKNRNGMTGSKRTFSYYPRFNWFDERGEARDWGSEIGERGDVSEAEAKQREAEEKKAGKEKKTTKKAKQESGE